MTDATAQARLLIGPVLRYVDMHRATVWVETDRPCRVEVRTDGAVGGSPTWSVHGHHYALVVLDGLSAGSEHEYQVLLDGARLWPDPDPTGYPPSVIRTLSADRTFRLAFGSCRRSAPFDAAGLRKFGADALVALADRMSSGSRDEWPDALFLLGDQVYADMPSPRLAQRLAAAHDAASADVAAGHAEVMGEIWNYEEYTWLYAESWTPRAVRWLLSTVPSCMMLDDHDLRDDWNTSASWRADVTAHPWWRDRATGAFASYWVYQHLGNLSPDELADDPTYAMVRGVSDDAERTRRLDEFAWRSDVEPASSRWSFRRELGTDEVGIRLVALDSRCARRLDPSDRAMLDDDEWAWVVEQATAPHGDRPVDHLLLGSTLPFLLLPGIHHLEGWNEALCGGAWGRRVARISERVRRAVDLEHWASFRTSLDELVALLERVVRPGDPGAGEAVGGEAVGGEAVGAGPASVLLLSGDVHCSYAAQARLPGGGHPGTAVHQLTMSPFRNPLHLPLRGVNRLFERDWASRLAHRLARRAGVCDVALDWSVDGGLWFDNGLMTVVVEGRRAHVEVDHAHTDGDRQVLRRTATLPLTSEPLSNEPLATEPLRA